jgi:hypothetical protein
MGHQRHLREVRHKSVHHLIADIARRTAIGRNGPTGDIAGKPGSIRLSRNLAFVATLMESGVEFVAVEIPTPTSSRSTFWPTLG